nr:serine/threonine-protein kinase [Pedobacter panaciterrae]
MSKVFTITEGLENMGALRTGGQGSVYKGKRMGAIITAVKILPTPIHTENTDDRNFRNFKNEVEKLKKVNEVPNPNVVKILNSGLTESGSFPFIEMEYIEGPDLEELLKSPHNPIFTIRETIKLAEQLANALSHCHRVGVKHGDIKSNNVKFNTDTGNYILLDFGLAIMSDEQRRSSVRHAGAVEFMAPEQHDGEMFFQTDVYSYGVILYELLAGTVPFPLINKGETARNSVMLAHMEKQVPDLLALRRAQLPENWSEDIKTREMNVPVWLLDIIKKCLEKQPESRFASGMALQDAVLHNSHNSIAKPAVAITNVVEAPSSSGVRVSKPLLTLMILAIIMLGMLSAYAFFFKDLETRKELVTDSTNIVHQDIPQQTEEVIPDTTTEIKPIILDTTAQQTDQDSLKKEFERQTGASTPKPTPPPAEPKKEGPQEPVIFSEGKKYRIPKTTIYFHDSPNNNAPSRGVLGLWVNSKFEVIDEQGNFIYVTLTNNDGEVTKGWLKKTDLKEVPQ